MNFFVNDVTETSDLHQFLALSGGDVVDIFGEFVGEVLNELIGCLQLVLSHVAVLFHLFGEVVCLAADVSDRDFLLLN